MAPRLWAMASTMAWSFAGTCSLLVIGCSLAIFTSFTLVIAGRRGYDPSDPQEKEIVDDPDQSPYRRDKRHTHAHGRTGDGSPGRPVPRFSRILVLLAAPAAGARRGRVPCRSPRHARLRPDRSPRADRPVHALSSDWRHRGSSRRLGCRAGGDRRSRLGRAGGVARRTAAS